MYTDAYNLGREWRVMMLNAGQVVDQTAIDTIIDALTNTVEYALEDALACGFEDGALSDP